MKIGTAFGVPVYVGVTYPAMFGTITGGMVLFTALDSRSGFLAALTAWALLFLGLLASLLTHEFAHVLVGRFYGVTTERVECHAYGAAARMTRMPKTPKGYWRMAVAGPLASFVLSACFLLAARQWLGSFERAWQLDDQEFTSVGLRAMSLHVLAKANFAIGTFNLLPAYPMDGGRVVHALLWKWTGDWGRSKRLCLVSAFACGIGMIGYGVHAFVPVVCLLGAFLCQNSYTGLFGRIDDAC